jgi:IclR family acetate operon transcriptional repressor
LRNDGSHPETTVPGGPYGVAVLGKALDLLEALAAGSPLGLSELSLRTGVTKASAFRVLSTLERRGYVGKDPDTRKYRPGPGLIALGTAVVSGLDLVRCARSTLEALHAEFRETVNLGVLSEGHILYLDMLESRQGLHTAANIGSRDPLHCTSLGKAMLACLPPDEARRLLGATRLTRTTPRTLVTLDALERELEAVRRRGFALDDEENEVGARCVGVAVRDAARRPLAALSVSGPAWRLDDRAVERIGARLRAAANELERHMGFHPLGS